MIKQLNSVLFSLVLILVTINYGFIGSLICFILASPTPNPIIYLLNTFSPNFRIVLCIGLSVVILNHFAGFFVMIMNYYTDFNPVNLHFYLNVSMNTRIK